VLDGSPVRRYSSGQRKGFLISYTPREKEHWPACKMVGKETLTPFPWRRINFSDRQLSKIKMTVINEWAGKARESNKYNQQS
jgi:hypothetical protein